MYNAYMHKLTTCLLSHQLVRDKVSWIISFSLKSQYYLKINPLGVVRCCAASNQLVHLLGFVYNCSLWFKLVEQHFFLSISVRLFGVLGHVCFPESGFWETTFQTFLCLFAIRKVGQRKTLSSQRKIWLGFQESVFLENFGGKHFPEVVKNLEMSYYLLIISNLVRKLLIAIYIYIFCFEYLFFNFIF